ncbi:MAG: methyltransferase [Candidatus Berkelbacteria bacterium]|nr:methyltransferase [Candidatus Berkelbacteria bacterium]
MIEIILVLLLVFSGILLLWQISNIVSIIHGSPYVMMDKKVIRTAFKLAGLKKGENFYDLGCGNGDVLIEAAKFGARAEGFEISPYYYLLAKIRTIKYKNIKVYYRNINSIDISKVEAIYCYLLPKILTELQYNLKNIKKNTRVISIGFPIDSLKLKRKEYFRGHNIYIY